MENGKIMEISDQNQVASAFSSLSERDNSFLILGGDDFVQTALSDEGYIVQYKFGNEFMEKLLAKSEQKNVENILINFFNNDYSFKNEDGWSPVEVGGGQDSGVQEGTAQPQNEEETDLFKDPVGFLKKAGKQALKQGISQNIKRGIGKTVNKGIGGILKKIIK